MTVLEAIRAFEKISGLSLNYTIGPRRPGDVISIFANNDLARTELGWIPKLSLGRNDWYCLEMGAKN